ncbi:MAG: CvpA family protein [Clostridia bacterium]|nr:CvpA family protein [Clostridia bacterium]
MAHIIIDIACVVVAAIIIIKFTVTGFFRSVLNSCKLVISVVLAFILKRTVSGMLANLFMRRVIVDMVTSSFVSYYESNQNTTNIFLMLYSDDKNNFYNSVLADFGVDLDRLSTDFELLKDGQQSAIASLGDNIGGALSSLICTILALVLVFAVSMVVLSLLVPILEKLTAFDGVKTANRLLGLLMGVIISAVVLWGISLGLYALTDLVGPLTPGVFDKATIESSMVVSFFRNVHLIEWISGLILK